MSSSGLWLPLRLLADEQVVHPLEGPRSARLQSHVDSGHPRQRPGGQGAGQQHSVQGRAVTHRPGIADGYLVKEAKSGRLKEPAWYSASGRRRIACLVGSGLIRRMVGTSAR